jgi:uncharacterized protein YjbI with pentapeptide repeats
MHRTARAKPAADFLQADFLQADFLQADFLQADFLQADFLVVVGENAAEAAFSEILQRCPTARRPCDMWPPFRPASDAS